MSRLTRNSKESARSSPEVPAAWGMTPHDAPEEVRATWLDPAIMGPPVVWLASRASDGHTDQRIVATEFAATGGSGSAGT